MHHMQNYGTLKNLMHSGTLGITYLAYFTLVLCLDIKNQQDHVLGTHFAPAIHGAEFTNPKLFISDCCVHHSVKLATYTGHKTQIPTCSSHLVLPQYNNMCPK